MKKSLATLVILSALVLSGCAVGVSPVQPPNIDVYGHPSLVVIPGTYVYAMTDVADDIFFHVGSWWRLWDGQWYTSRYYDRGWSRYRGVPSFYRDVDPDWREFYRHRRWHGHPWECERIPAPRVQTDWNRWQDSRYWEREKNWGVQGFRPAPYRQAGSEEYRRDDSRGRQQDRQRGSWTQPDDRQAYPRGQEPSRSGQPFFGGRREDDRQTQTREGDRYRDDRQRQPIFDRQDREDVRSESRTGDRDGEERERRRMQPTFERQRRDDGETGTRSDRQFGDQQDSRRGSTFFGQGRREPESTDQQRSEHFRGRQDDTSPTPLFQGRQRDAGPERVRREDSGSRQPGYGSRQREVGQDKPQQQERGRDTFNRRRTPQEFPGQGSGAPGAPAGDAPGMLQSQ